MIQHKKMFNVFCVGLYINMSDSSTIGCPELHNTLHWKKLAGNFTELTGSWMAVSSSEVLNFFTVSNQEGRGSSELKTYIRN